MSTVPAPGGEPELAVLFARARELAGPERERFLDEVASRDAGLAGELREMLAHPAGEDGWLDALAGTSLPELWGALESEYPPGSRIGVWEISEVIGSGGMGTVYRARDTELGRWAALKFLRWPGSDAAAEERVLHEARAAAALDHPNIGVVYQVGRTGPEDAGGVSGRPFLAMAYYRGQTLARRTAEGPQPVDRVLEWMIQLGRALEVAHAAGIVHGDLKPSNLILTDEGVVKVVDFGVATGVPGGTAGVRGGTPGFMSPEQRAGRAFSAASDIWSAGVMLGELVSGERLAGWIVPPSGELPDQPAVDRALEALELPASVASIVHRCLRTDPSARYPGAGALVAELEEARRRLAPQPADDPAVQGREKGSDGRPGVAVLPFVDGGLDPAHEYFVDGLTAEVVDQLAGLSGLRVISRSSVMRLKGRGDRVAEAAAELGVRYVVEGVVRRSGERLRVTARLVDTERGEQLWSGRFDGSLAEVFSMEESVARGVAEGLALKLSAEEKTRLAYRPIEDVRAYDAYLRARHLAWRFSAESLAAAERSIEEALTIVGDNALLHGTMGHILALAHEAGIGQGPPTVDRVERLADRVFALEPDAPRGHWLRAFVAFQRGDVPVAVEAATRALVGAPQDPDVLILAGYIYSHANRNAEALRLFERAEVLDPLTPLTRCMPGFARIMDGDFQGALGPYRTLYELDPDSPFSMVCYGWVLDLAGHRGEAVQILDRAAARFPGTPFGAWAEALKSLLSGHGLRAERLAPLEAGARGSEMFARAAAQIYGLAGEVERCLDWLEHAVRLGLWNEPFLGRHDPYLASVRGTPRFRRLMAGVEDRLAALPG
jgi:serine/threonine-protein kinase